MELVSIGREAVTIKLFDTKGAEVKVHASLTVDDQQKLMKKYGKSDDVESRTAMSIETVVLAFIEWNIGKDGVVLPCTEESLKQLTMRDFFAILQGCTGRKLLDDEGNILSVEQIEKKGKSA